MFTLLSIDGGICAPDGFHADGISAGLKPDNQKDLAFIYSDTLCDVDALFTANRFQAAPIQDIDEILKHLKSRFEGIVNPVMSSTGVIGVRLPKEKIIEGIDSFDLHKKSAYAAAKAIMTTDSYEKQIALEVKLQSGESFKIGAMAKGAGMINPALATMLCFITTDADVPADERYTLLRECAKTTFNAISVDGDTSTNDTVMLLCNRKSGIYDREAFAAALRKVMHELALKIVADGEGASKCVAFKVTGAATEEEAAVAAKALSNSLLVKTALYGEDPNWGRIASTIGASGVECDPKRLTISLKSSFSIHCDLGVADGAFTAYGCDLGYEYVKINADYRT